MAEGLPEMENETHSGRLRDVEGKALVVALVKALSEVEAATLVEVQAETRDRCEDQRIRQYGA